MDILQQQGFEVPEYLCAKDGKSRQVEMPLKKERVENFEELEGSVNTPEDEDEPISIRRKSDADDSTGQRNASSESQSTFYMTMQDDTSNEDNMLSRSNVRSIENERNSAINVDRRMKVEMTAHNVINHCQKERLDIVDLEVDPQ